MKANRKFRNKDGVSAVIGVILMVAITVAIAATVYVYVSQYYEGKLTVDGTVLSVAEAGVYEDPSCQTCNATIYNITLDDGNSYLMMFRTENAVVPPVDVTLRFYYEIVDGYYDVYKIKSL